MTPRNPPPILGEQAKAVIDCNKKLKELGIEETIKLPQICVIGDQSTGKSSLIEAISTIKVPTAKGLCTQTPLAINLSSAEAPNQPWTCVVSVEEKYSFNADWARKTRGGTGSKNKERRLGPWELRPEPKRYECRRTQDKEEVCNLIKAAQVAILSPGVSHEEVFANINELDRFEPSVKFSPNIIRLDVFEGSWPNLSFIDLPGVIAVMSRPEDRYLVDLVKSLAETYATDPNSIIMLTLPMTTDVENSSAYGLVQSTKAQSRTLAVLTKSDLASDDQRQLFLDKLAAHDEFEHGYHVVSMPDSRMSLELARYMEKEFFAEAPWVQLSADNQKRLGVESLTEYIRRLLFRKTAETLPENLQAIRARLSHVESELERLPAPLNVTQLPFKLQQCLTVFEAAIQQLFLRDSVDENNELTGRRALNRLAWEFREMAVGAKPTLMMRSDTEKERLVKAQGQIEEQQARQGSSQDPVSVGEDDDASTFPNTKTEATSLPIEEEELRKFRHRFTLQNIHDLNQQYYQSHLPNEIELKAVEAMNRLSVRRWPHLLSTWVDKVGDLIIAEVAACVHRTFGSQEHLGVYSEIKDWVTKFLEMVIRESKHNMENLCHLETQNPFTADAESLKTKEETILADRRRKRAEVRLGLLHLEYEAYAKTKQRKKIEESALGPDPFDTEIKMSAKCRAYYEVASARFVDNVLQHVYGALLPRCRNKMVKLLSAHLCVPPSNQEEFDNIVLLMSEDPERANIRKRLQWKQQQLLKGHQYIQEVLGEGSPSDDTDATMTVSAPETPSKQDSKRKTVGAEDGDHDLVTPSKRPRQSPTKQGTSTNDVSEGTPIRARLAKKLDHFDMVD